MFTPYLNATGPQCSGSFSCTGTRPANTTIYPGDDSGLTATAAWLYAASNTARKCEYSCSTGFTWNGSACVSSTAVTCAQQGGTCTAATACTGTQINLGQYDCASGQTCCKSYDDGSGNIKIDGSCGNAARNYKVGETQFVGSFCYTGVPDILQNGSQIAFPKKESPSSWTCLGMSGGKSSPLCKATYDSATPPNSCSVYTSVSQVPAGYGSPFNELSTLKEPTLSVTCSANGAAVTAGNSANSSVYKSGFYTENGQWKKMSLTGLEDPNNTGWFKGTALSNIPTPSGQNFTIAFICQYQNNAWKCGCRDSACAQNYWTIQSYKP